MMCSIGVSSSSSEAETKKKPRRFDSWFSRHTPSKSDEEEYEETRHNTAPIMIVIVEM